MGQVQPPAKSDMLEPSDESHEEYTTVPNGDQWMDWGSCQRPSLSVCCPVCGWRRRPGHQPSTRPAQSESQHRPGDTSEQQQPRTWQAQVSSNPGHGDDDGHQETVMVTRFRGRSDAATSYTALGLGLGLATRSGQWWQWWWAREWATLGYRARCDTDNGQYDTRGSFPHCRAPYYSSQWKWKHQRAFRYWSHWNYDSERNKFKSLENIFEWSN